ncbi:YjcQ family protein [Lysinibacillus xylanilyticus]|uniref:YjcQ family protein n=1 Tax=Lysinibacillus xylanilyticus TaxID=582475 RepID=UPI0037F866C1
MDKEKLILDILEGLNNQEEPKFYDFEIEKHTFGEVVEVNQEKGFISGASIYRECLENKVISVSLNKAKVESKGLNYIENNIMSHV